MNEELRPEAVLRGAPAAINALCFAEAIDGPPALSRLLVSGDADGTLIIWSLATRRPRLTVAAPRNPDPLKASADGLLSISLPWPTVLLLQTRRQAVSLWDLTALLSLRGAVSWGDAAVSAARLVTIPVAHFGFCNVLPLRDGADAALVCPDDGDGKLSVVRVARDEGERRPALSGPPVVLSAGRGVKLGQCMRLAASVPDVASPFAAGYESGHVVVLSAEAGAPLRVVRATAEPIVALAVALDGSLVVGSADGVLQGYAPDAATPRWEDRSPDGVGATGLRPDGRLLVAGGWDHRLRLYDSRTGKRLAVVPHHVDTVSTVEFHTPAPGSFAVGSVDKTISLWKCTVGM